MNRRLVGSLVLSATVGVVAVLATRRESTSRDAEGPARAVPSDADGHDRTPALSGRARRSSEPGPGASEVPPPKVSGGRRLEVVVTTAQGAPIPGALVTVQMQVIRVPTDAAGRARLGPLSPVRAFAWADAPGFVQQQFEVPAAEENDSGTLERTILLQPATSIAGRVTWADGAPAAGVDVEIERRAHMKTGSEGRFSLEGLAPGEHVVRVGRDRGWRWGGVEGLQARVQAGATDVVLTLPNLRPALPVKERSGSTIEVPATDADGTVEPRRPSTGSADTEATVTVLDDAGAPLPGAFVRFWPRGEKPRSDDTDASGRSRLRGWSPGSLGELTVEPPKSEAYRSLVERVVPAWRPGDEVVRLERGFMTSGVVRDTEGNAVADADVEAQSSDGTWESLDESDEHGTFQLPARPAGILRLRAHTQRPTSVFGAVRTPTVSDHIGAVSEVAAGASDVVLEVDLGPALRVRFEGWPAVSPTIDAVLVAERGEPDSTSAPVSAEGTVEFVRLDRDMPYSLWVGPLFGGEFALARGLRGGRGVQTIPLEQGLRTRVRVSGSSGGKDVEVTARLGQFTAHAVRQANGWFAFAGLPAGTWPVGASTGWFGENEFGGEATVTAGGEAEIALEPLPPPEPIDWGR